MKESIRFKLESVRDRFEELAGLLADPDVISDQNQFRDLSKEYSRVEPIVKLFSDYESIADDIVAAEEMTGDSDAAVREMGQEELASLAESPRSRSNSSCRNRSFRPTRTTTATCISKSVPARAATRPRFSPVTCTACTPGMPRPRAGASRVMSAREGEHGGYKEIIGRVTGNGIYAALKFESGAHRVQRVPMQPNPRAGFTRRPAPLPYCRRSTKSRPR